MTVEPLPLAEARPARAAHSAQFPRLAGSRMQEQLLAFARDLKRSLERERARAEELEQAVHELEEAVLATVQTLAFVVEAKDADTHDHLTRSHEYAVALAERVAPSIAHDRALQHGFLLHDVGKIAIPEHVLKKPGALTDEEWAIMRTHPELGGRILAPMKFLAGAIPVVEGHHERWDGRGYPRGLAGEEIPLGARIFAVVDAYDAMTSDRPYRPALRAREAVAAIEQGAGTQFDPRIAGEFAQLCAERRGAWPILTQAGG